MARSISRPAWRSAPVTRAMPTSTGDRRATIPSSGSAWCSMPTCHVGLRPGVLLPFRRYLSRGLSVGQRFGTSRLLGRIDPQTLAMSLRSRGGQLCDQPAAGRARRALNRVDGPHRQEQAALRHGGDIQSHEETASKVIRDDVEGHPSPAQARAQECVLRPEIRKPPGLRREYAELAPFG